MESETLKRPSPPSLFISQNKFLMSLALSLFFFSASLALFIYVYQRNILKAEAFSKTELVMTAVASTRSYVRETLRPKMYEVLGEDAFILEAMSSSYVSRAIMDRLQEESLDFEYRRVSQGALNPEFEANVQELEMIQYFNEHPLEESWQGIKTGEGGRYYVRYSPVTFNKNCFRCHGEPDDAPPFIREKYGSEVGFSKQNNTGVGGVVSIAFPVESGLKSIKEVTYFVFGTVLFSILMLYACISFFYNRLVVQNIRGVLDIFWSNLADDEGRILYDKTQKMDEVEELKAGAEIIADHLHSVRQQIHDYATNLEKKVEEQTRALRKSAIALEKKVDQRNEELRTLNNIAELLIQSARTKEILSNVLQQALKVIPAQGAGIYLCNGPACLLELKCQENANGLIEKISCDFSSVCKVKEKIKGDELLERCEEGLINTNFIKDNVQLDYLNVPLICRDHALGVMTLTGLDSSQITTELRELLLSIGRQLGIMLENIENTVKLIRSKEILQSVFDGITDFVVLLGGKGEIVRMINESLRKKYDLKQEQILGRSVRELARDYSPFQLFEKIMRVPINEPASDLVTLADGTLYEVFFYPVFNDQGILENVVCSAKDVTHKKQIEQKKHQTEKLAAIGQLAAGIAHEVNNPLGIILCYASLLKEDLASDPDKVADIEIIEKQANNCQRIVSDLLHFSHAGRSDKSFLPVNECVLTVVDMLEHQFNNEQVHIATDLQDDLPLLNMDQEKMKQVMVNILINAIQAIGEDGTVQIATRYHRDRGRVAISIEDNGTGMDSEMINKVFEPFYTTKKAGKGTGLGLSLSLGIVEEHGGDIQLESVPGSGTKFTILLPVDSNNTTERGQRI